MDDIFRSAAEHYPIKTDVADWDKMRSRLNNPANESAAISPQSNYRISLSAAAVLLAFLIPTGLFVEKYFFDTSTAKQPLVQVKKELPNTVSDPGNRVDVAPASSANRAVADARINTVKAIDKFSLKDQETTPLQNSIDHIFTLSDNKVSGEKGVSKTIIIPSQPVLHGNELPLPQITRQDQINELVMQPNSKPLAGVQSQNSIINSNSGNAANENAKSQIIKLTVPKRFYLGLLAGPDFSTVKFQSVKSPGLNYGIIAGYRIKPNLNIEISIIKGQEHYFTEGKYLSKDNIRVPNNTEIINLNGKSRITEMPVAFRYNFNSKKGPSHYFATFGVTSIIIHDEQFDYALNKNGSQYVSNKSYKQASSNVFANLQVSAGYEGSLNRDRTMKMRIEPYYQLPLKGVGRGDLPVTNFGLKIGFTRDFK